jgi:hypothetical protein
MKCNSFHFSPRHIFKPSPEKNSGLGEDHRASGFTASATAVFPPLTPSFRGFIPVIGKVSAAAASLTTASGLISVA